MTSGVQRRWIRPLRCVLPVAEGGRGRPSLPSVSAWPGPLCGRANAANRSDALWLPQRL